MKKLILICLIAISLFAFTGCDFLDNIFGKEETTPTEEVSNNNNPNMNFEILTENINSSTKSLEIKVFNVDENKTSFVSVANQVVLNQKLKNDSTYTINISGVEGAYNTSEDVKVQLFQTEDDTPEGKTAYLYTVFYKVSN
ncbi:hypothetical protein [Miniphocaeibacter massiliensis]|uniref:hypothetical protein n=1 Tax=Miniphocaeibacter massiliensis TaxID=2041841 RepID=UPI000C069959|nr:hypothetical protein [Miniphocaeibacter massiliensis]